MLVYKGYSLVSQTEINIVHIKHAHVHVRAYRAAGVPVKADDSIDNLVFLLAREY